MDPPDDAGTVADMACIAGAEAGAAAARGRVAESADDGPEVVTGVASGAPSSLISCPDCASTGGGGGARLCAEPLAMAVGDVEEAAALGAGADAATVVPAVSADPARLASAPAAASASAI